MNISDPTRDRSMFWGHPLEFWDLWGIRLMFGGAALGAVALFVSLTSAYLLYRVADTAQTELQSKTSILGSEIDRQKIAALEKAAEFEKETTALKLGIAAARTETAKAVAETAKANERIGELQLASDNARAAITDAHARSSEATLKLEQLRQQVAPRHIQLYRMAVVPERIKRRRTRLFDTSRSRGYIRGYTGTQGGHSQIISTACTKLVIPPSILLLSS